VVDQLELTRYPRDGQFSVCKVGTCQLSPPARVSTLRERAAIAIIKNVPHMHGSELFQSVGNPATIGVKRTILAARGA
jgi:hypothetical protein